jgi:hypothetical protein
MWYLEPKGNYLTICEKINLSYWGVYGFSSMRNKSQYKLCYLKNNSTSSGVGNGGFAGSTLCLF